MKYRPEVDGLRAVAVVPVILFHAGIKVFSGGFVGVDVFFVISGYLITLILLDQLSSQGQKPSFGEIILSFYERRARRILPTLFVVMFVTSIFSYWILEKHAFEEFGIGLAAVSLFVSNILFWTQDNYFASPSITNPLLHTWSLAVEEQFYLVFPILLVALWRFGRKVAGVSITVIASISLGISEWSAYNASSANFFLAHTRAHELLIGSLCAFALNMRPFKSNNFLSALGLVLIISATLTFDETTPSPGLLGLVPVLGAALVILFADGTTLTGRLLSMRVPVSVGLISYSAYLWHQPLFALARVEMLTEPSLLIMLYLSGISLLLAWVSWALVEQPFRKRTALLSKSRTALFGCCGTVALCFIIFGVYASRPSSFVTHFKTISVGQYVADNNLLRDETWGPLKALAKDQNYKVDHNASDNTLWFKDPTKTHLLLVGNSHSKDLYNSMIASKTTTARFEIARYGLALSETKSHDAFFKSPNYLASEIVFIATKYNEKHVEAVSGLVEHMLADHKRVVIVLNTPEFSGTINENLADRALSQSTLTERITHPTELIERINSAHYQDMITHNEVSLLNSKLIKISEQFGISYIDRRDLLCDELLKTCYGFGPNFVKHFYDYGHLTMAGAAFSGQRIDELDWLVGI